MAPFAFTAHALLMLVASAFGSGNGPRLMQPFCPAQCDPAVAEVAWHDALAAAASAGPASATARPAVREESIVTLTVYNSWFANQTALHVMASATAEFVESTSKIYACVDDVACSAGERWDVGARQNVMLWDARKWSLIEGWVTKTHNCHGWRSVQVPKAYLLHKLIRCGCSVMLIDLDFVLTLPALAKAGKFARADVMAERDFKPKKQKSCQGQSLGSVMRCTTLNFGRMIVRATPGTLELTRLALEGTLRGIWDQGAFNAALLSLEALRMVSCCQVYSLGFASFTPEKSWQAARVKAGFRHALPGVAEHAVVSNKTGSERCGLLQAADVADPSPTCRSCNNVPWTAVSPAVADLHAAASRDISSGLRLRLQRRGPMPMLHPREHHYSSSSLLSSTL